MQDAITEEQFEGCVQDGRYGAVPGMTRIGVAQDEAHLSLAL